MRPLTHESTPALSTATAQTRVVFINTATLWPLGADTWVLAQIMKELDRSAHSVFAACATGTRDAPTPTFQVLSEISDLRCHPTDFGPEISGRSRFGKALAFLRTLRALPSIVELALFIRRQRIAIIHTVDRPRDALASVLLARLTGAKCIIHVHVGYGEWMSPMLKWSLKRADALMAISEFVKETLVASGHDPAKIQVVLNGIEPADWNPGSGRDAVRREFGMQRETPVVVSVCRLFPSKGPADLIRVLPGLRRECPDVRLVIVGKELVPGYRSELERLARELGVAGNVVFTGHRKDVEHLMAAADIFAMPSIGEPFGLVYLEAMAMELPVVALESGGAPEVVEQGVTGLLSAPGDLKCLEVNLQSLLRSPDDRRSMGAQGRERVELHFTTRRMAHDAALVYRWLMS